jgi:hypothetical protein
MASAAQLNGDGSPAPIDTESSTDGVRLHGGTKLTNDLSSSGHEGLAPRDTIVRPGEDISSTASELPSFMVSAPGKVIVYGEHAVVHGKVRISLCYSIVASFLTSCPGRYCSCALPTIVPTSYTVTEIIQDLNAALRGYWP